MRFSKSIAILASAGLIAMLSVTASATEYLFKLRDDAALLCDDEASLMTEECFAVRTTLSEELGIYKTDDIEIINKYKELDVLEFFEENVYAELMDMPSALHYTTDLLTGYKDNVSIGAAYSQLNVDAFWKLGFTGKGVRIAVIDSGVSSHSALGDNILEGYNYPNESTDVTDEYGHGTLVAGLIAANSDAYRGIAYEAEIIPIKVFSGRTAPLDIIAEGFLDAVFKYDCDIINMSFGVKLDKSNEEGSPTLRAVIDEVYADKENEGVVFVSACGNHGSTTGTTDAYMYPASYDEVVSVGNIDVNNVHHYSSGENDQVDVVAPGRFITLISNKNPDGYVSSTGTSFSCPMVSGIVALIKQADPTLTHSEIRALLQQTAYDLGNAGKDDTYGYGKADCAQLVKTLLDGKFYRSPLVAYKGTYNIAVRNGLASSKDISVYTTESDGAQQVLQRYTLDFGEYMNIEAPPTGLLKLLYPNGSSFGLFMRNGLSQTYTSRLIFANYNGNKMTDINGQNVKMQEGSYGSYSINMFNSGETKVFELGAGLLSTELLLRHSAE